MREVAFILELHTAFTRRISAEWKAMALRALLALHLNRDMMRKDVPTQKQIVG